MTRSRIAPVFLAALALAGCNGVPITTAWKLRNFRLDEADIAKLRFAVRPPAWVTPTPDGGKAIVSHWIETTGGDKRSITVRLAQAEHPGDAAKLAELARGAPLTVIEADRRDLPLIRAEQEAARARGSSGDKRRAEIDIDRAACREGEIPDSPILFDVYIHANDETDWLPLLQGHDIRPGDDEQKKQFLEKFAEHVPLCGKRTNRAAR